MVKLGQLPSIRKFPALESIREKILQNAKIEAEKKEIIIDDIIYQCSKCSKLNINPKVLELFFNLNTGNHYKFRCNFCKLLSNTHFNAGGVTTKNTMGSIIKNSAIYLTISDGKICRRVQSPTATSKERQTKDGKLIHEEQYHGWSGKITDIQTRQTDYGKEWNVTIEDGDTKASLQMKYSSGYASAFLKTLPNVDLSKDVQLMPKSETTDGKTKTTMFIKQDGKAIKWAYTKDNPNGLPSMKKIKVKGVDVWDDSDMMEYLESMVKSKFANSKQDDFEVPF
jgi:hypothetical protein